MSGIKTNQTSFFLRLLTNWNVITETANSTSRFRYQKFLNDHIKRSAHIIRVLLQLLQEKNGQPSDRTLFVRGTSLLLVPLLPMKRH